MAGYAVAKAWPMRALWVLLAITIALTAVVFAAPQPAKAEFYCYWQATSYYCNGGGLFCWVDCGMPRGTHPWYRSYWYHQYCCNAYTCWYVKNECRTQPLLCVFC